MKKIVAILLSCVLLLVVFVSGCSNNKNPEDCEHFWNSKTGKCAICGATCEHDWDADYCNVCKMTCAHTAHDQTTEKCALCGLTVRHKYENGKCVYCNKAITYTEAVAVEGGQIRGYSNGAGTVNIYKGVPYAASTAGNNRWRSPQPVEEWSGVKDCIKFGPASMQRPLSNESGYAADDMSEDSLSLNIWAPVNKTNCPVLVFIHGGGNVSGGSASADMDGENFAANGAVFVSINYRLGIFGFLATEELIEENDGAGNFAILDMIKSLQWIQDYISLFGGNPDNVTISGQSAGSMNVQSLTITSKAKGLFKNAIAMSGPGFSMSTVAQSIEKNETRIAGGKKLSDYTLDELRQMDAKDLVPYMVDGGWGACLDNDVFIANYNDSFANGTANDVNLIIGMVTGDTSTFGTDTGNSTPEKVLMTQVNNVSTVRKQAADNHNFMGKTYVYYFDFYPSFANEAYHGVDVQYFLNNLVVEKARSWRADDYTVRDNVFSYILNFVKTSNPNGEGLTAWTENVGNGVYMNLNVSCVMRSL